MTHIIHFVRHGQYDMSNGSPDGGGLTALGQQQAMATGRALADSAVRNIFASTMTRATETAQIIAQVRGGEEAVYVDDILREVVPTVPPELEATIELWVAQGKPFGPADIARQRANADKAFETYCTPDDDEEDIVDIIVCHGNLIRYLLCRALEIDTDAWVHFETYNCGITTLLVTSSMTRLVAANQFLHLPESLRTES